ncbi:hypothetical protein AAHC03_025775 [Spirometra sp. Aus1]
MHFNLSRRSDVHCGNHICRYDYQPVREGCNLRLNGLQPIGPGAASADFLTNSDLANHTDLYPHTFPPSLTLPGRLGVRNGGVSTANFPYDSAFHIFSVSVGLKSLIPLF